MSCTLGLNKRWFYFVKKGLKTIEGRLDKGTGKYLLIKPGEIITFICDDEKLNIRVKSVRKYDTFRIMLMKENMAKILPDVKNLEEGVDVYRKIYGNEDRIMGVLAIELNSKF
uniref:ASC-1 like domain protein n=1 Tax=Pithovirus LCPAC406 TaxID=2506599 RepID=A0A481ZFI0_9VIRU|nr:MAG: ASC-1 like domain protein [Pithovirus LCPAC406]